MLLFAPILFFAIIVIIFSLVWRNYFKNIDIPPVLAQEGFSVPIINSARGSFWFNVHNGAWPKFTLFEDKLAVLVLGTTTKSYAQVSNVDVMQMVFPYLVLSFSGVSWKIYLTMNKYNLKQVLLFLKLKNCPLSAEALKILNN